MSFYSIILLRELFALIDRKYNNYEGYDKKDDIAAQLYVGDREKSEFYEDFKRSQLERGSLPEIIKNSKKRDIDTFIDIVFDEIDSLPEFTESFFTAMDSEGIFPEELECRRDSLLQTEDYKDEEYFSFVANLIKSDIKNGKRTAQSPVSANAFDMTGGIYFPQIIIDADNENSFEINRADFSLLKKDRLILIEGEGGLGKSTFLSKLDSLKQKQKTFSFIISISLAGFVEYIFKSNCLKTADKQHLFLDYLSKLNMISVGDLKSVLKQNGKSTLLLIDGYNEAYTCGDASDRNIAIAALEEIKKQYANITFVVTSRPTEGGYSFKNSHFLSDFKVFYLSGVSNAEYEKFTASHPNLSSDILELAKIPLYFKALNYSEHPDSLQTKNDLLREIYYQCYMQASQKPGAENIYSAFYLLAPAVADYMNRNRLSSVTNAEILAIAKELFRRGNVTTPLLHSVVAREQQTSELLTFDAYDICNVLINNGPMQTCSAWGSTTYSFFHQEIQQYLVALNCWMTVTATKLAVDKNDFLPMSGLVLNINLQTETRSLFKERVGVSSADIDGTIGSVNAFFTLSNQTYERIPQQLVFYHSIFLMSEFLDISDARLNMAYHQLLLPIVEKLQDIIECDSTLSPYLDGLSEKDKERCRHCSVEILLKDSQFVRALYGKTKSEDYYVGAQKLVESAKKIGLDNSYVLHQEAKLYTKHYEYNNSVDDYFIGMEKLEAAAKTGFNLSANMLSMLKAAPPMQLIENKIATEIDWIGAFWVAYNSVCINEKLGQSMQEIKYASRQSAGLLLKGYVSLKEGFNYSPGKLVPKDAIVPGNKNTFSLSAPSVNLAKFILDKIDGVHSPSLNYLRGIIKLYEGKPNDAETLFRSEANDIACQIVLNYKFNDDNDIDSRLNGIVDNINSKTYSFDQCNPVYWGIIDSMNLELSLNPSRQNFYNSLISRLNDTGRESVRLSR